MDQDTLLERIETVNQSLGEVSKRLGRLERSALPFDFGSDSSEESARITSLLTVANDAIRRLAGRETQPEILEEYLGLASTWVPRSVLFLNRNGTLVPWRATGLDLDDLARVKVKDKNSLMARCVREQSIIYAEDQKVKDFGWGDEDSLPKAAVGIPLCFDELVPVVLYADSDENFSPVGLEFLSLLAALVLKNHALQQGHVEGGGEQSTLAPPPIAPPDKSDAEEESAAAEGAEAVAAEEADEDEAEETIEPKEKDEAPAESLDAEESAEEPAAEELSEEEPAAEEAEDEEAADEPEEVEAANEEVEDEELVEAAADETEEEAGEGEEEKEKKDFEVLREEAFRFARLLVSEIKLYNSEAVDEGRETSDIYDRLRHDIDRSWEMYERRAHPSVRSAEDCFDLEVVRILASGERKRLGEQYPGPRVS